MTKSKGPFLETCNFSTSPKSRITDLDAFSAALIIKFRFDDIDIILNNPNGYSITNGRPTVVKKGETIEGDLDFAAGGLVPGVFSAVNEKASDILANTDLSQKISIVKGMAEQYFVPLVINQLAPMPMPVPINSGGGRVAKVSTSITRRL